MTKGRIRYPWVVSTLQAVLPLYLSDGYSKAQTFWRKSMGGRMERRQRGVEGTIGQGDSPLSWLAAHGKFLCWVEVGHNGSASIEVQTEQRQQTVSAGSFGEQKQVI